MATRLPHLSEEQIARAFIHHYSSPASSAAPCSTGELIDLLTRLPALSKEEHVDTIGVQLGKHHPGLSLTQRDHALIAFVDDAISELLRQVDLDFRIEAFVRDFAPHVAAIAIRDGVIPITSAQPILSLLDSLIRASVGWSEDLGILGDQFMERIQVPLAEMANGRMSIEDCQKALQKQFSKEAPIHEKREQQLRDSALTVLAGQKALYHATKLLNQQMNARQLPMFIIFVLQGAWFEFLQGVFLEHGADCQTWTNAERLTEALIWSMQPNVNPSKQRTLMAELPGRIRKFCNKMHFDTTGVEHCLADLEGEYQSIAAGNPSDPCDFELLDVDPSLAERTVTIAPDILHEIQTLAEGRWFLYDDKSESDEKVARIRLILNWQDSERLLFTNHNRRKVLIRTYGELANQLGQGTVRPLDADQPVHELIGRHLLRVLNRVSEQNKAEKRERLEAERRRLAQRYRKTRNSEIIQAQSLLRRQAKAKARRARVLRNKAIRKHRLAVSAVQSLRVDAWVNLPIMEGTQTPCKLVAIIGGQDKYMFTNRAGIKVAEFTGRQLANMIVTENSEILDTGAEFENVLASVVTGLRASKNKSYEELTGDIA